MRAPHIRFLMLLAAVLATAPGAGAQWLKLPTPGIPRLADGKPNLAAPSPRTADGKPDFSGLWENQGGNRYYNNIAVDLQPGDVAPWADAIYQRRRLEFGKDSMETTCQPFGPVYLTTPYREQRIVQTPTLIVFLFDDMMHREIFMDGRSLEADPNPTWMGYSVGRWEGDVLVVDSNGYSDRSWLDFDGHPHTEALRVTERYTRRDLGHIDVQVTMVDPKAYMKPITLTMPVALKTDTELLEYVGAYDLVDRNGRKGEASVALTGSTLVLDYGGKGKEGLIPLSATQFSWSGSVVEFVTPSEGGVRIVFHYAEGNDTGTRRR